MDEAVAWGHRKLEAAEARLPDGTGPVECEDFGRPDGFGRPDRALLERMLRERFFSGRGP